MTDKKEKPPDEPLPALADMLSMTPDERARHELRLLQGLMAKAIAKEKFADALKIFESAHVVLNRRGKRQ